MIELPEATIFSNQMTSALCGKVVRAGTRGNAPHKFAFYSYSPEEYEKILPGKRVGEATPHGSAILVRLEPGYLLVLGVGGERILLHQDATTLPKKHQLLLEFTEGTHLSVSVQGWGAAMLLKESEASDNPLVGRPRVSPVADAFSLDYFLSLFDDVAEGDARAIKYFVISKPGVWGVGNGYLQDILFRARVHPRKRATLLTETEKRALHKAIRETLSRAVALGGRDTERDLFGSPGRYVPILDKRTNGTPCPVCSGAIEKQAFLGGAIYFCPRCQSL